MSEVKRITSLINSRRFSLSDEKKLQAEMEDQFTAAGIEFKREHRLDAGSIIDFLIGDIGVEVKIKGGRLNIYRQVERYAGFEAVRCLLLVTNVPMGLPALINGKPVHVVNLSRAWL